MDLEEIFRSKKPVIGMIHLAGAGRDEKIKRALEEMEIYEEEGIDGAIIEDYHGSSEDILHVLRKSFGRFPGLVKGINVLRDPYSGFVLANRYGARFVQFDSVQTPDLDLELYDKKRGEFSEIAVLGGVGFKYTTPTGNSLEVDLEEGKSRCEAIVTTGVGTGMETPIDKLIRYKEILGEEFPLIVGAGVNLDNVVSQMEIVDGAIIGSYFKPNGDTHLPVERKRVRDVVRAMC